jgi:hypothetical protein
MAKKAIITRIRTLYAIFMGVIAVCIGLFFLNVFTSADPIAIGNLGDTNRAWRVVITDLEPSAGTNAQMEVEGLPDSLGAWMRVKSYDVSVVSEHDQLAHSSKATWCMGLQLFSVLLFVLMDILALATLISFYINGRRGKVFPKKKIRWLTWIGVLMILMSLSMDVSIWIEQSLAASLLAGSNWEPSTAIQLHTTRLFFGLTIIFLAQIFYIGREMQEEQELTI